MKNALIALVALLVIGGAYYWYAHRATSGTPEGGTPEDTAQSGDFTGSFSDLIARGGSWKCTLSSTMGGASSKGTTYVSGGMVRADISSTVEGYGEMESHMIGDGTNVYTWSPMMPFGVKASMTGEMGDTATDVSGEASFDAAGAYSYHCEPWAADQTMFELPTGITFKALPM